MIGLVMGIINEETKKDFFGALEKVASIGYKAIETGKTLAQEGFSREEVKQKLDSFTASA